MIATRRIALLVALGAVVAAVACRDDLTTGVGCPSLCPGSTVNVRDTILDAVTLDTGVIGYPPIGTEPYILLASRPGLDTRGVIRFDTLPNKFTRGGVDSSITRVDSARLILVLDRARSRYQAPITITLYDVDSAAVDTDLDAIKALFRDDRRIGAATFDSAGIKDTLLIPIDSVPLLDKITNGKRLRVGLQVSSPNPVVLRVYSRDASASIPGIDAPAQITYDPHPDTAVRPIPVAPESRTPNDSPTLRVDLTDFFVVFQAPQGGEPTDLSVGGIPGERAFMRFNVPSFILDSSTILRATLFLTQKPNRASTVVDTIVIYPRLVTASDAVTDVRRAAELITPPGFNFDSLTLASSDSGQRRIEIVNALLRWAFFTEQKAQRAVVLTASLEGALPGEVLFYSTEAPAALRPRLRVSYSPRTNFAVP
ncbi:MAG: hypothetical protein ACREOG_09540 [Gemmatimonadaceae bacterium]